MNGGGTHRLLLLRPDGPGTAFPLAGQHYPVGSALPDGSVVVGNGAAGAARLPSLDPTRHYYARVVEYHQDAGTGQRPVYTLEGNPRLTLHPGDLDLTRESLVLRPTPSGAELPEESTPLFDELNMPEG